MFACACGVLLQPEFYGGEGGEADVFSSKGVHDDDLPFNLKTQMPFSKRGILKRWWDRMRYQKEKFLVWHQRPAGRSKGVSGGAGLEPGRYHHHSRVLWYKSAG